MTQAPAYVWEAFGRTQTLSGRTAISNETWAADEAGELILDMVEHASMFAGPTDLKRLVRNLLINRAAKHRRRSAIKAVHYDPLHADATIPTVFDGVAARMQLRRLEERSRPADWSLLVRIGMGASSAELALTLGTTQTAVKKRVVRARERLAA